jgi:hypothetical protein
MAVRAARGSARKHKRKKLIQSDLSGTVYQSAIDKLLGSVNYPFCAFDQTWPFTGQNDNNDHLYSSSDAQVYYKGP